MERIFRIVICFPVDEKFTIKSYMNSTGKTVWKVLVGYDISGVELVETWRDFDGNHFHAIFIWIYELWKLQLTNGIIYLTICIIYWPYFSCSYPEAMSRFYLNFLTLSNRFHILSLMLLYRHRTGMKMYFILFFCAYYNILADFVSTTIKGVNNCENVYVFGR